MPPSVIMKPTATSRKTAKLSKRARFNALKQRLQATSAQVASLRKELEGCKSTREVEALVWENDQLRAGNRSKDSAIDRMTSERSACSAAADNVLATLLEQESRLAEAQEGLDLAAEVRVSGDAGSGAQAAVDEAEGDLDEWGSASSGGSSSSERAEDSESDDEQD